MRFVLSLTASLALAAPLFAQPKLPNLPPDLMAPTDALSPADERKAFTVPAGFEVQLVASEPDIQKPIQMAFDAKGRLWVTTSYHYPFASAGKPSDKLFVLSDFDANGKAKTVQTFADDLNIPIGILPLPDCKSCIVSSVGEIRKYTDTKGTGKADAMEVLYKGFGSRDTHGMYNSFTLMPDGWVYACHGFNNDSSVTGKDGHEVKMQSGNTFRFRPDGSRIEVWTRGQVNPFGMAVDPWFNLYTADCHSKPITQLIPGGYYDSFGKPHDGLGYAPHVTAHPHKSTGLCGLVWYDADHFPKEYKGTMMLGDVVSNCISADRIEWKGASPVAKELPDFLTSKDRWFRPVDIKLGPDGALYVADFYNKIIGHYEVDLKDPRRDKDRGRVWRIVWKGVDGKAPAPKFHRADFTKADNDDLLDDLFHPNLTVRFLAGHQLRARSAAGKDKTGSGTIETLKKNPGVAESVIGWSAFIMEAANKPKPLDFLLTRGLTEEANLKGEQFTGHVVRAMSSRPSWGATERKIILDVFKEPSSVHQTRACIEAVIAHPHADFVPPVIAVLKKCSPDDNHLRLAAKIALRNCFLAAPYSLSKSIGSDEKTDLLLVEVLLGARTASGAKELVAIAQARNLPVPLLTAAAELVGRYGAPLYRGEFTSTVAATKDDIVRNADVLLAMFRGVQAQGTKLTENEVKQVTAAVTQVLDPVSKLAEDDKPIPADAVARTNAVLKVVHALPTVADAGTYTDGRRGAIAARLGYIIECKIAPNELRVACCEAQFVAHGRIAYQRFRSVMFDKDVAPELKERLLIAAAGSNVPDAQMDARDALKNMPYRVAVPIGLALAGTPAGADILLVAVKDGKAPQRLLQEKAILERLKGSNPPGWEKRVADLTKNLPPADQRIAALLKTRADAFAKAKPDKAEGAKLFTKHCAACHRVGDVGGKIAPQLDGVGVRGVERLLEDILDPNRNVDQAFRARSITLTNDKTLTALMLRVEGEVLVVADLEGKEQRIPLKEIAVNRETMLSAMPANFDTVVPEADLHHIVAYLLDQKAKDPPPKK